MSQIDATFTLLVRVAEKKQEATDIVSFLLEDPHGRELPEFSPGAHIDIRVADGLVRQYSLSTPGDNRTQYRIAVLREPESRGGSVAMHDNVNEGDLLLISAPRNHFELNTEQSGERLLFAGGIGITPILAMAHALHRRNHPFRLHYGARSADRIAFRNEIEQTGFSEVTQYYLSDGDETLRFRAQLPQLVPEPDPEKEVYVCGPSGFIDAVTQAFVDRGWEKSRIRSEYFAGADIDTSDDGSFTVELASSGEQYRIPADQTVFEVLDEAGVFIPTSCEQGVCGTCLTRVLEGEPDHRDLFMDDDEHAANDQFTPCCSRSKSEKLVLDL